MKVDKAVCTSNDAFFPNNTATNELNSIIKFETVFTTLVENKILAIKRECEQHDSKKKSRTLKKILSQKCDNEPSDVDEVPKKSRKSFFLRHKNKHLADIDVEKGEKRESPQVAEPAAKVELESDKVQGLAVKLDSQSNEHEPPVDDGRPNCDKSIVHSQTENAQLTLSTSNSSNVHSNKTIKEQSKEEADESIATTVGVEQSSVIKAPPASDLAICDDGVSSQNTSDIEFSLVSESVSELPRKKASANSDPIIKKPAHLLSPPLAREIKVTERKAISCQSTPLFGRHQQQKGDGEVKKVLTFQEPKAVEKVKSQTIVIAPTSTTTTTTLAKPISTHATGGPMESVHATRKSQKSRYRDVSVEYEISYDDDEGNQSPRGFISSFNQLTSQMPPATVITANPKKLSLKQLKAQSKEGRNQQEAVGGKADDKTAKHHEIELELDDLAIDVGNKKKRRRSKYCEDSWDARRETFICLFFHSPQGHSSRCSDPVIYPSSSGLKHCILSRPPNQPM